MLACMGDEMAHGAGSALGFDSGADDTLLQLQVASDSENVARVTTSVWSKKIHTIKVLSYLAVGFDHHVRLSATTAAIEKSFRWSHCGVHE